MTRASPWWARDVYADRRPFLKARARIAAAARRFFDSAGFIEVDTAALQVSGGVETHISLLSVELREPGGGARRLTLHSSPEFSCKKLLAAGEEKIFTLAHVFRDGERSALHHPEFSLLEWYRAGAPYTQLMEDCAGLLAAAAEAAQTGVLRWRGGEADPFAEPERVTLCEAFERHAQLDLAEALEDREAMAQTAARLGLRVVEDDSWSDLFSKIVTQRIEPHLGRGRATVLCDYPASEAALARRKPEDPRFCERFEFYACGVELANAFGELTDAAEQRRRFEAENDLRRRLYGDEFPIDEGFLQALEFMPAASGCALGFDRLVMLAAGATRIEEVLWTPVA
jgi:elongation factor P--(R)-beta-lysine ligase